MKTRILMVCLGNICRSPLAEGILKSKLPSDTFHIDSAGTSNWHIGKTPDTRSISDILDIAPNEEVKAKVALLLNECHPGMDYEVPDPYYGGNGGFHRVYDMIDEACEHIANKLI